MVIYSLFGTDEETVGSTAHEEAVLFGPVVPLKRNHTHIPTYNKQ